MKPRTIQLAAAIATMVITLNSAVVALGALPSSRHVTASVLVGETAAVPGETLTIGWRLQPADGWHLYTNGRSDTGLPPAVDLQLPDGWSAGPLHWPVGKRYPQSGGILDHVYDEEFVLLQTLQVGDDAVPGTDVSLIANLRWLACREICVPGDTVMTMTIPVASDAAPRGDATVLASARRQIPRAPNAGEMETAWSGHVLEIRVPGAEYLEFHPADDCGELVDVLGEAVTSCDRLAIRFRAREGQYGPGRGVLIARSKGTHRFLILNVPAAPATTKPQGE